MGQEFLSKQNHNDPVVSKYLPNPMFLYLSSDASNHESFEAIKKAIFMLCLDSPTEVTEKSFPAHVARQGLYGGGSNSNSGNRWFDKTLQVGAC